MTTIDAGMNAAFGKKRSMNSLESIENGKNATPSYGIVDSQSVKTVSSSDARGLDGNKKIKGRKRPIVVDTLRNLIAVVVLAAHLAETKSGCDVLKAAAEKQGRLDAFSGDEGYRGTLLNLWKKYST